MILREFGHGVARRSRCPSVIDHKSVRYCPARKTIELFRTDVGPLECLIPIYRLSAQCKHHKFRSGPRKKRGTDSMARWPVRKYFYRYTAQCKHTNISQANVGIV